MKENLQERRKHFYKFMFFLIVFSFGISIPLAHWHENLPVDCRTDFRDDSFMKTMYTPDGGDDYVPAQCANITEQRDYELCYYINATQHQRDFSSTCRWLGPEYFAGGGTFAFRYGLPIMCLIMIIISFIKPKWILDSQ